jgi:hypothetical protein
MAFGSSQVSNGPGISHLIRKTLQHAAVRVSSRRRAGQGNAGQQAEQQAQQTQQEEQRCTVGRLSHCQAQSKPGTSVGAQQLYKQVQKRVRVS